MTSYLDKSAESRINDRNSFRNLETFLSFSFLKGARLQINRKNIYNTYVDELKCVDKKSLSWRSYIISELTFANDLNKICKYISKEVPSWRQILSKDNDKFLKLERHLAILERVVIVYNKTMAEKRKDFVNIDFKNPIKHLLLVNIHYPEMLDSKEMTTVVRKIFYDRLTSKEDLTKLASNALSEPVALKFMGDKKWDSESKNLIKLNAIPSNVFKNVLMSPSDIADPKEEPVNQMSQTLDVVYENVDWSSVASGLYFQGQNEAMPNVYKQGFSDGRKIGYSENLASITSEFNKALKK